MAEITDNAVTQLNGLELYKCQILSAENKIIDLKPTLVEINYFEDIFSNATSGNIVLNDSGGLHNAYSWCGDEFVLLEFDKPGNLDKNKRFRGMFRIFKTQGRHLTGREFNETFVLHFCCEEEFLSNRMQLNKSYKQMRISDIVKDIALNVLKIPKDKFPDTNIEPTFGKYDIVIPNMRPLEAVAWLCTMAIADNSSGSHGGPEGGATYLFYKNRYGWNFRSILSIFNNIPKFEYKSPFKKSKNTSGYWYGTKNLSPKEDMNFDFDPFEQIISYQIVDNHDAMDMMQSGMVSNKLIAIDYLRRTHEEKVFDYEKYFNNHLAKKVEMYKTYNKNPILSNAEDRFKKKHNEYQPVVKIAPSTTNQKNNPYIKERQPNIPQNFVENTIPYRFAQLGLINFNRLKLLISGDPYIAIGNIIYIHFPQAKEEKGTKPLDRFLKGRYLVSAVRQRFDQGVYETVLECVKDAYCGQVEERTNVQGLKPFDNSNNVIIQVRSDNYKWW